MASSRCCLTIYIANILKDVIILFSRQATYHHHHSYVLPCLFSSEFIFYFIPEIPFWIESVYCLLHYIFLRWFIWSVNEMHSVLSVFLSHKENPLWIISMLKSSEHKEYSNSFEMPHTHLFFFFLRFCCLHAMLCLYREESMTKKYVFSTVATYFCHSWYFVNK